MRIGVFGNTNNYPLLLALGLRRLGHDAVLAVNRKERLHRPEGKYPDLAGEYPSWILDCSHIPEDDFVVGSPSIAPVLDFLASGSEGLILNHLGPSLLEFCPMPAVALMTGSDLTYYADPGTPALRQTGWSPEYASGPDGRFVTQSWERFVARQRAGIAGATMVSAPPRGIAADIDRVLDGLAIPDERRMFLYIADTLAARPRKQRTRAVPRIVNGARLNWVRPLPPGFSPMDHKGTDVLLHGFARFIADGGRAELVLFRKGLHVAETERLVADLRLGAHVTWRDEVSLREFHDEIAGADIVCDQLGESFPGMVTLDAMACGVPVIAKAREALSAAPGAALPICQASTIEEVARHLRHLTASERARQVAGMAARRFAETHLSPESAAARCVQQFCA